MAAATSSLPEHVGGVRNWDHRYPWGARRGLLHVRTPEIGMTTESASFLPWMLTNAECCSPAP